MWTRLAEQRGVKGKEEGTGRQAWVWASVGRSLSRDKAGDSRKVRIKLSQRRETSLLGRLQTFKKQFLETDF